MERHFEQPPQPEQSSEHREQKLAALRAMVRDSEELQQKAEEMLPQLEGAEADRYREWLERMSANLEKIREKVRREESDL